MNQRKCGIWKKPLGLALAVLLGGSVLAGCFLESEQNQVMGPLDTRDDDPSALKAVLSSLSGTGQPQGDYFVSATPPPYDEFIRSVPLDLDGEPPPFLGASDDPRLPALQSTGSEVATFRFRADGAYFTSGEGMDPATVYVVLWYRAALIVNGELDHLQVIRGQPVDDPDEWVVLGGSGPSTDVFGCWDFPDTNPCSGSWSHAGPSWSEGWGFLDYEPPAPNTFESFGIPQRNLMVVHEYNGAAGTFDPTLVGPPVLRQQIGVALDPNGDPIPDAFAPTPTEPILPEGIPLGAFTFRGLAETAGGGGYALWTYNSETGEFITQVDGEWSVVDPDEGIVFVDTVTVDLLSGFNNSRVRHSFDVNRAIFTGDWITEGDMLVLTLEGQGQSPGQIVMWAKIKDSPADVDDMTLEPAGPLQFGTLSRDYEYSYSGTGTAFFFGDELRLELKNLSRPPVGYFYEVWLSGETDLSVGSLTTPAPDYTSLLNADVEEGGVVVGTFIRDAALLTSGTELGVNWGDYTSISVSLSPKNRAGLPVSVAMTAAVPEGAGQ